MNKMLGVVLAGGSGTRLRPLTKVYNKCTLPVGDVPMIYHSIHKLVEADIKDIAVIVGSEHAGDVINHLGSGAEFNAHIAYFCQDEPTGIPSALALAKPFLGDNKFALILSDNIFGDSLIQHVKDFIADKNFGEYIFLKKVLDPERYGVISFDSGEQIIDIVEKPEKPPSEYAVTGIYFLDSYFWEIFPTLKPSDRLETEIVDVHKAYLKLGRLKARYLKSAWYDVGTLEAYREVNTYFEKENEQA